MIGSKNKIRRYKNLVKKVVNWRKYLWKKVVGFDDYFEFHLRNSFSIKVPGKMLPPFKENFFDEIYLYNLPAGVFDKEEITVVDIGGNVGFFSLMIFSKFPKAKVFSFEPHPYCYGILEKYKNDYSQFDFQIFRKAVSDKNESITLNTSDTNDFATMSSIHASDHRTEKIQVEGISLERILQEHVNSKIDLLKIDCEGAEYAILYNLPPAYFKTIRALSIETHRGEGAEENLQALATFLTARGYAVTSLDEGFTGYIWAWTR